MKKTIISSLIFLSVALIALSDAKEKNSFAPQYGCVSNEKIAIPASSNWAEMKKLKSTGDFLFSQGDSDGAKSAYDSMLRLYGNACGLIMNSRSSLPEYSKEFLALDASLYQGDYSKVLKEGVSSLRAKEMPNAIEKCSQAIDQNHLFPLSYLFRSLAYSYSHCDREALSDLNALIKMYPEYYYAHKLKGELLFDQGEYEQALTHFNRSVELFPSDADQYVWRGEINRELNNPEQALSDFNKAIESSEDIRAYYNRGVLYFTGAQYDKALLDFIHIAETEPAGSPYLRHVYWRIANIYIGKNEFGRALDFLDKLIRLLPEDPWAYQQKGCVYMQMKMYKEALSCFELALKFNPASDEIKRWIKHAEMEESISL